MKTKLHRAAALLLSLCLLLSAFPAGVFAEETAAPPTSASEPAGGTEAAAEEPAGSKPTVHIATLGDLQLLAENCRLDSWSQNRTVVLDNSIDLAGADFNGIPTFGGTFEGQDYAIEGLSIVVDGSTQGLFRYIQKGGVVQNLTVRGTVMPTGTQNLVGGIAGSNAGALRSCVFDGVAAGSGTVGGIAGVNEVSGVIDACRTEGTVYGAHFIGGVAGKNLGVLNNCTNNSRVNTTVEQNEVKVSDLTIDDFTATERAADITDVGGIAGNSTGVVRSCTNQGAVGYQHIGYNVGGIIGSQTGYVEGCVNYGAVYGRKEAGGIVGQMEPSNTLQYAQDTLQDLQGELNTLQALTDKACSDAAATSSALSGQLNDLQEYIRNSSSAVEALFTQMANGLSVGDKTITTDLSGVFDKLFPTLRAERFVPDLVPETTPTPDGEPTPAPTESAAPTAEPLPTAEPTTPAETPEPTTEPVPTPEPEPEPVPTADPAPVAEAGTDQSLAAVPEAMAARTRHGSRTSEWSGSTNINGMLPALPTFVPLPTLNPEISVEVPNIELTNRDQITAARSDLNGNLTGIMDTVDTLNNSTDGNAQVLIDDVQAIMQQITKIANLLAGAADTDPTAGDIVQDISDDDTEEDTEGKVYNCINAGAVQADLNAGGITGAMAVENDLDPEDDVKIVGQHSLNATYRTRVVLRDCFNNGTVSAKKQDAGGIVGYMEMGTVLGCRNMGRLDAADAACVGGIAGESAAIIRESSAKCRLSGASSVGGIAGKGRDITDCRSMIKIEQGNEALGAIAGSVDEAGEVHGNYFVVDNTLGGIDGISYAEKAEPLAYADFIGLENLPEEFKAVFVNFIADGQPVHTFRLDYGSALPDGDIPAVPPKEGSYGSWPDFETETVTFDENIVAVYTPYNAVITSTQTRGNRALVLAEGRFGGDAALLLEALDTAALPKDRGTPLEGWRVSLPEDGTGSHTLHYLLPEGVMKAGDVQICVRTGDAWNRVETTSDGSYLVFPVPAGETEFCALPAPAAPVVPLGIGAGVLAVALLLLLRHGRKRRKAKAGRAAASVKTE